MQGKIAIFVFESTRGKEMVADKYEGIRWKRVLIASISAVAALAAILIMRRETEKIPIVSIDGFTQGTVYNVKIIGDTLPGTHAAIDSILGAVEKSMSLYDSASLISRLNRNETDQVDDYIAGCIAAAAVISEESGGLYDITVKPLTGAYGFAGGEKTKSLNIDSLLQIIGYKKIAVREGRLVKEDPRMQIDLNSIAQGAAADYIAEYLDGHGFGNYLVSIGNGEIFAKGLNAEKKAWVIGIDKPFESNIIPGMAIQQEKISLSGRGLATSGNYRKFYTNEAGEKIVHTVNPLTGLAESSNLLSATVVAEKAAAADVYGTLMMVMGLEKSKEFLRNSHDIDAYLIYAGADGKLETYMSPGMQIIIKK